MFYLKQNINTKYSLIEITRFREILTCQSTLSYMKGWVPVLGIVLV